MVFLSVQYLHNVRIINTVMVFLSVQYLHNVRIINTVMVFLSVQYLHNVRIINTVMVFLSVQYLHNVRMVMIKCITCHDTIPDYFLASSSQKPNIIPPRARRALSPRLTGFEKSPTSNPSQVAPPQDLTQFSHSIIHHKNKLYQSRPGYIHICYDSGNSKTHQGPPWWASDHLPYFGVK